jgi:hypothetical protein
LIHEEIKSRIYSGNASYHSNQKILSFHLLYKYIKIKIYKAITFHVVLYGCETWSLTLREHGTVAEENIWTQEQFNDRRLEKLLNERLHNLYSSPRVIQSRRMRRAGHVARTRKNRNACREDNIKTHFMKIGLGGVDLIHLA